MVDDCEVHKSQGTGPDVRPLPILDLEEVNFRVFGILGIVAEIYRGDALADWFVLDDGSKLDLAMRL